MDPSVRKGSIRESDIGKACGSNLEVGVVGHEVFHDALAGSHDIHRIGSLIGGDAEEVFRRIDAKEVHQLFGLDVVVLDECLNRVFVLLRTYVLVGREIGNDVEASLLAEDTLEDRVCKVERITAELLWYIKTFGRANVTDEFCESVLVEVNDNDRSRLEVKNSLDEAGANRACTTDYTYFLTFDLCGKCLLVCLYIRCKHADGTIGYTVSDEFL